MNFSKKSIGTHVFLNLLVIIFFFQFTLAHAQSDILIKHHMMYTNTAISNSGITHYVQGMIDTGCSVCFIDSTYAVDSCHIKDIQGDRTVDNTSGKSIKSSYVYLDSISFGGAVFTNVWCFIADIAGKLQQFAPKFIIGGDALKRDTWCFDLRKHKLQCLTILPSNIEASISWKNYADGGLNEIYFKGKIGGKTTRILFDTGARYNELLCTSEFIPTSSIKIPSANMAETLSYEDVGLCNNIPVEVSGYSFKVDFIKPNKAGSETPRINADFLQDKRWVLDYKHRHLYILAD